METSDSECFESADEEFDENEKSQMSVRIVKEQFKNLTISDDSIVEKSNIPDKCNIFTTGLEQKIKTNENSVGKSPEEVERKLEILEEVEKCEDPENKTKKNVLSRSQEGDSSNEISIHEVFKSITFEENEQSFTHTVEKNAQPKECDVIKKNDAESVTQDVKSNSYDNLWEGDGWDIEEGIDIPSTMNEEKDLKDPLAVSTENMWDNQEWDELEEPEPKLQKSNNQENVNVNQQNSSTNSWASWGNWGVTSLLSTATQSVSTITNQVSQGISSVIETGIGIPSPEELAKINTDEEKFEKEAIKDLNSQEHFDSVETDNQEKSTGFGFGNFGNLVSGVSNITKFVETTSTKVISGGLETLETIGKKTMEVLQEGDPGLKKKRVFLKLEPEKPVLSQVLREAKEKAEHESKEKQCLPDHIVKKINYEALFDDYHGLVHLEALEMLSKQSELKLKTLCDNCSGDALVDIQETMDQIKELCELPDEDEEEQLSLEDIKEKLQKAVEDINVNVTYERLISSWEETECWLDDIKVNMCSEEQLHQQAIETLAQLTALAVEQYHKAAELLLIKDHHSTADEADSLVQLTTTLTSLIGIIAAKFSDKLNLMLSTKGEVSKENVNNLITNVFFEASNSSSYIQDAFQLLIPVLQVGAI